MKSKFFLAAFAALSVLACNKNVVSPEVPVPPVKGSGECLVTVNLGQVATKVASQSETNEKNIQNVQVFVFRAGNAGDAGFLEATKSAGFDAPINNSTGSYNGITIKCSTGQREVWVVVNDSVDRTADVNGVATKAEFLQLVHKLETSTPSKLFMIGRSNPEQPDPAVTFVEGAMEVSVPVHRVAAAVVLESVKNQMLSPAYQKADMFRLEAAYLLNVPGSMNFAETSEAVALSADDWYAKLAPETAGARGALLYERLLDSATGVGEILQYGSTHNTRHTFYAYPNSCEPSVSGDFSPRATLLVLEASINYNAGRSATPNWVTVYYPVVLKTSQTAGLQSNKVYHVGLTINRPGSMDPNKPVTFSDVTPTITVSDWQDGDSFEPVI